MWWCCGKRSVDAPGCQFNKHEPGGEQESDDGELNDKDFKLIRCQCCRELGHSIENCLKDPNFLTKWEDVDFDLERINKISDLKKYHANSHVNTI